MWAGVQRATCFRVRGRLSGRLIAPVGEATVKVCGVAVAMLSGYQLGAYLVDRRAVNMGTVRGRPGSRLARPGLGQARCQLLGTDGTEAS
jgi:hypothetical protein